MFWIKLDICWSSCSNASLDTCLFQHPCYTPMQSSSMKATWRWASADFCGPLIRRDSEDKSLQWKSVLPSSERLDVGRQNKNKQKTRNQNRTKSCMCSWIATQPASSCSHQASTFWDWQSLCHCAWRGLGHRNLIEKWICTFLRIVYICLLSCSFVSFLSFFQFLWFDTPMNSYGKPHIGRCR